MNQYKAHAQKKGRLNRRICWLLIDRFQILIKQFVII